MGGRMLPALFILILFIVCVDLSFGQAGASFAQLNGTVVDASGGTVGKATVTLREGATNRTYTVTSSDNGNYVLTNLPPGEYELKVSCTGFAPYRQTEIVLRVGQVATVYVNLRVATGNEQVVVNAEVPSIDPTMTEISQVIEKQQIQELPTSNRVFTDFALLARGVVTSRTSLGTTFTEFEVTQISFGGMRSFSNMISVDGADFVNTTSGVQRSTPPQDAVQEFRVVNHSFTAEYGRALGGIVNIVTRSGTNDLHGSAYDYFQDDATDSRSLLQPSPLPHYLLQNVFGGAVGGPVKKDKAFFFLNYEGKRRDASPTFAPDLYNHLIPIDQAKGYLGLSPEGCYLPPSQCTGTPLQYLDSVQQTISDDTGFAKFDYEFNTSNHMAIRYNIEDSRDYGELVGSTLDGGGIGTPSGGRNLFVRDQSLVGTWSSVIRPTLVNSVLVQWARRHYNFPGATGEPDLSIVNDLEFGHNFGTYDAIYESRLQFADSVSWVKGNHTAKFGFDGNLIWAQNHYPGFTPERIIFPNLSCTYEFANFVEGAITGTAGTLTPIANAPCPLAPGADGVGFLYWGVALPRNNCPNLTACSNGFYNGIVPPPATGGGYGSGWPSAFPTNLYSNSAYNLNHGYWGFFAQDQWRVTPKLTLNYGLRWDFESGLTSVIDSYYGAWQPRVGLAYSPNSKTVIRAGYGTFFDRNNMTFFFTTGNLKTNSGYFCNPPSADHNCALHGFAQGVNVPMIHNGAQNGGGQLSAQPGFPGTPSIPCSPDPNTHLPPTIFCTTVPTVSVAALTAFGILAGGPNSYNPVTLTGPCVLAATGTPSGACGVGSGGIQRNGNLPYAEQASLEIAQQFGAGFTVDVGYLFVGAHRLVRGNNLNVPCPAGTSKPSNPAYSQGWLDPSGRLTACSGAPTVGPFGLAPFFSYLNNAANPLLPFNPSGLEFSVPSEPAAPNPTLSGGLLDYNNNVANAAYNGLVVSVTEKASKYFNMNANYTYSHAIDNGNFTTFINLPPNQFDYAAERGNSNQDLRHHFIANFTATAPDSSFLRNFQFSSIITLQSGRPFTLFVGNNTFGDLAGSATDRVGGPPFTGSCTSVSNCSTTVGRNTYTGDQLYSWDLRVSRYFVFRERYRISLMFDAFNVLNRPNVDEVNSVYGSPVFCGISPAIPRHYKDSTTVAIQQQTVSCASQKIAGAVPNWLALGLLPLPIPPTPNPVFGTPRTMLNQRLLQFSVKFSF